MIEVVAAVISDAEGKVLCMQRGNSRYAYTAYKYEFPGGKIEAGETPQEALRRELIEEMDLQVRVGRKVADVVHEYPDFRIRLQAYRCTAGSLHFRRKEHVAHQWLPLACLGELDWAEADRAIIDQLLKE